MSQTVLYPEIKILTIRQFLLTVFVVSSLLFVNRMAFYQGEIRIGDFLKTAIQETQGQFVKLYSTIPAFSTSSLEDSCTTEIVRGPYLQNLRTLNADSSMLVIKWRVKRSTASNGNYKVIYSKDNQVVFESSLEQGNLQAVDSAFYEIFNAGVYVLFDATDYTDVHTNFSPNTKYEYQIVSQECEGLEDCPEVKGAFVTPPIDGSPISPNDKVKVWAMGDAGSPYGNNLTQMKWAYLNFSGEISDLGADQDTAELYEETDLILNLGDNAYGFGVELEDIGGDGSDLQMELAWFNPFEHIIKYLPLYPTSGNHDIFPNEATYEYAFDLPTNTGGPNHPSGTELYYSYNYANIHFVSINSQSYWADVDSMALWLEHDLEHNRDARWTIVYMHVPVFTAGSRFQRNTTAAPVDGAMVLMMRDILPVIDRYEVDLLLSGHNHFYERSYLVDSTSLRVDSQAIDLDASDSWICDYYNNVKIIDQSENDVYVKDSLTNGGTVFVTCGSSSKTEGVYCNGLDTTDGYRISQENFFNHPIMVPISPFHSGPNFENANEEDAVYCDSLLYTCTNHGRGSLDIGSMQLVISNDSLSGYFIGVEKNEFGLYEGHKVMDSFTIVKNYAWPIDTMNIDTMNIDTMNIDTMNIDTMDVDTMELDTTGSGLLGPTPGEMLVVYPNPARSTVTVRSPVLGAGTLKIYSLDKSFLQIFSMNGAQQVVDVSSYPIGLYFFLFENSDGEIIASQRVVKF